MAIDLRDPAVVYGLLFEHVESLVESLASDRSVDAVLKDNGEELELLSQLFAGRVPGVVSESPEVAAARLARRFFREVDALPEAERALLVRPEMMILWAVTAFHKEASEAIRAISTACVEDVEGEARRLHDLCAKWAAIFCPPSLR